MQSPRKAVLVMIREFFLCGAICLGTAAGLAGPLETFERHTFDHGPGKLSTLYRPGSGFPLVLIPGTFSDSSQWVETVKHLPSDLPLVLIELRGHGESWPPKPNNSIEELARDTLFVLSQLGIDRFFVGGHSLGGMISIEIGRVVPDRVQAILSVEGWTNHLAPKDAFNSVQYNKLTPELKKESEERRARFREKWGEDRMTEFAQAWKRWDGLPFLKTTDLPVLEVYGDRGLDRTGLQTLLQVPERPNITFVWIAEASHDLPREQPEPLGKILTEFLRSRSNAKD